MAFARTFLGPALVAAILSAAARAQEKVHFDPTRDLPGFEETRSSELKDLFPVDAFADLLGHEMDAKELAEVQARWKAESAAIQVHLDEVRTNPVAGVRWVLEKRMGQHKFFSKVTLTVDASVPPYMIFVQKPSFDDPNYAPALVQLFAPYLTKIAGVFDERVAKPSGATRRANRPLTPIVILASPGDFDNYYRLGGPRDSLTKGADYDPKLDIVVFAVNSFEKTNATPAILHPLLRESFLSFLTAHAAPPLKKVPSMWLREGLASAFTWPRAGKVEALDKPEPRIEDVKLLVETCHSSDARLTCLNPVSVLSSLSNWDGLTTRAFNQPAPTRPSSTKLWSVFLAQSSLWVQFLSHAGEGKYRARFEAYLKTAMTGQSGADALSFAFADTKLADLDKAFWAWVYDEHQRLLPNVAIDRNDLNGLFDPLPKPGANDELVARAKASLTPEKVEPPFDPTTLAIGENDVESRHGLALVCARSGDFEAARTMLEAVAASKPAAPEDGRIARDIVRVNAAIALRDGLIAGLIAKNARLAVEINGKKVNAPVAKVENGQILFGENSYGAKTLALAALDPLEIAKQADKKELQGNAPPWARPWLYLLCGDARWEKLLRADSTEAREVKEDGTVWYRDRLQSGVAAGYIEKLSRLPVPTSRAEASTILDAVQALMTTYASSAGVLMKKSALEKCARSALLVMGAESDGSEFVHGKFTAAADGTATVTYEFDTATELSDFKLDKGHLLEWRKMFSAGDIPEDQSTSVVKDGSLQLRGNGAWRLPIGMIAPFTLTADFSLTVDDGKMQSAPNIGFTLCDEGPEKYIFVDSFGQVMVTDTKGTSRSGTMQTTFGPNQKYTVAITHDGKHVSSSLDGTAIGKSEVGGVQKGPIEILAITASTARIHRLEITGKVDPASLAVVRGAWVTRMLGEMGF
jgi:hypothetical protein